MRTPLLALALATVSTAVIVDRVAIAVGNIVITDSEIEQRIRLTAFENSGKPDFSPASRRIAAQLLIDQKLIEREMSVGRYPPLADERRQALFAAYPGQQTLASQLADFGLTPAELEEDLARQANLLTFLDLRFRPAVQVSAEDTRKFFDQNTPAQPETQPESQTEARYEDKRAAIEELLTRQRADKELETWLADQRKRTRIDYREPGLR